MTKSKVAGSFISCTKCGTSTSTFDVAVQCSHCDELYELKPDASYRKEGIRLTSRQLRRRRFSPSNWFLEDEDWSVADIFYHLLRLPADKLVVELCKAVGKPIVEGAVLEDVLFWPRLLFGVKTIHPDVVIVFDRQLILFEFKRPGGAELPGWEISGQVAFAHSVEEELGHDWTLIVIPGPSKCHQPSALDYANQSQSAEHIGRTKYGYSETIGDMVASQTAESIAAHIGVLSWESFLENADTAAIATERGSWQSSSVRRGIREFHRTRAVSAGFQDLNLAPL
jgi:hypothetical protein